jgi:hypothetical protein
MTTTLEAQGVTIGLDDASASPLSYTTITGLTDINGPDGSAPEYDITSLASTAREYRMGLHDEGNITLSGFYNPDDTGQTEAQTARKNRTKKSFKVSESDSPETTHTFDGYVTGFSIGRSRDQVATVDITIRITGDVTTST